MKRYPYTKCLNPRIIVNKYTGQEVETGCGVCKACLLNRANKMSSQCSIEEQDHKYVFFFTLTYADEYVPRAKPCLDEKTGVVYWYSICDRLKENGQIVCIDSNVTDIKRKRGYLGLLLNKTRLDGAISYASRRDAQLFIKRVRKRLEKYTNEKIRYYIVSEYGPKTFRAHYHGMLFADGDKTCKVLPKIVRACWPYGRVDMSLSRGKCSSYVAQYLNSTYFVPSFYANGAARPFTLHSIYFAQGFYKSQKKEIYEAPVDGFVRIGRVLGGKYVEFMPWRSLACTFFPRCRNYARKDYDQLYQSYTILRKVRIAFGRSFSRLTLSKIAEKIIKNSYSILCNNTDEYLSTGLRDVSQYFINEYGLNEFTRSQLSDEDYVRLVNKVTTDLRISRHFLTFVCDRDTWIEHNYKLCKIMEYWSRREYESLSGWYRMIEEYQREYPSQPLDFFYVTRDRNLNITSQIIYKNFVIDTEQKYEKSIKHKRQNDANGILIAKFN